MRKRIKVNDNFFSKPTLLNSYWAGFIAADGCILKNAPILQIGLSSKDKNLLFQLKNDINYHGKILDGFTRSSTNSKFYPKSTLRIRSEKITKNLYNQFNITPKKSWTLKPPKDLTKNQKLCFIVGYIDGDGCIHQKRNNIGGTVLKITGNKNFLSWIKQTLETIFKISIKGKIYKAWQSDISFLLIQGRQAFEILDNLEKLPIKKLSRKWSKVLNMRKLDV